MNSGQASDMRWPLCSHHSTLEPVGAGFKPALAKIHHRGHRKHKGCPPWLTFLFTQAGIERAGLKPAPTVFSAAPNANLWQFRAMETALYLPVKRFLEARGFQVKGEICGCDLVALPLTPTPAAVNGLAETPAASPPLPKSGARRGKKANAVNGADTGGASAPLVVIGELKQRFTLELLLQGVDRMA